MSGVRCKNKKSQSRKPASVSQSTRPVSVSQSRRPKSSVYSSVRQKSLASKKNLSVKIRGKKKEKEKPIKLQINFYNTDLSPAENALFMLYEAFHDLIYDTRGNKEDIGVIRSNLEPILRRQAEILSGIDFDFGFRLRPDLNTKINLIHRDILIRLSQGQYANFEKLLLMRIIDFCGEAGNSSFGN